ncbi:MAG: GAF domain-containing protein, partial [Gammaproteobacteria bacterium]|nr:GAF domain-containing protein [Gammaproteobacteria bacterium]
MDDVFAKIGRLNEIGIALSAASDVDVLCDKILTGAMELTNSDGGSLYGMSDDKSSLEFLIVSTHSLGIHMGGNSGQEIQFPAIPLIAKGQPNKTNVVSSAVHDEHTINIPDVYYAEGFDFSGTRKFDQQTGYRTQSILTIPLKNHHDDIIGVLQLINAKDEVTAETRAFSRSEQQLAESLASQAAVAITNNRLIEEQRELFEAFIKLMASAIDEKSPYTGGHCKRVPELTMMIADACHHSNNGALKEFKMTDADRYELTIAGWLHDCGKVTTPEYIVDKATKLETIYDRINTVDARFEVLKRDATIDFLQQKIDRIRKNPSADCSDIAKGLVGKINDLNDDRDFIRKSNVGGEFMDEDLMQRIRDIAEYRWIDPDGVNTKFFNDDEIENLTISRGTLTDVEREVIQNHMAVTIKMLAQLPFPKHLLNVPEYAGGHHERMDGKGYPNGLTRDQMSVQARMMGIADIFEALSASDRPYKMGKPLTECLRILGFMKQDHHIDPDIFDVFIRDKVYLRYAEKFLPKNQIDEVDHSEIPG